MKKPNLNFRIIASIIMIFILLLLHFTGTAQTIFVNQVAPGIMEVKQSGTSTVTNRKYAIKKMESLLPEKKSFFVVVNGNTVLPVVYNQNCYFFNGKVWTTADSVKYNVRKIVSAIL